MYDLKTIKKLEKAARIQEGQDKEQDQDILKYTGKHRYIRPGARILGTWPIISNIYPDRILDREIA